MDDVLAGHVGADASGWFREAKYGMFIHFGPYSLIGRESWLGRTWQPFAEYQRQAGKFKAGRFDACAWARLAKRAGMRYMVLTAKHNDGYCLFRTSTTDFQSLNGGPKRDLVGEFVEACRKEGLRVGLYYSVQDWAYTEALLEGRMTLQEYRERILFPQVRELCSQYGTLDVLWFDGGTPSAAKALDSENLLRMAKLLQPALLVNDRTGTKGDFGTPEQRIDVLDRLWETCMTLNTSWGFHRYDHKWKSPAEVIQTLAICAHNGGNFLLNVGPRPDGTIPRMASECLGCVGRWLEHNGQSLFGTAPHPFNYADQRISTVRGSTAYFHIFPEDWMGRELILPGIGNQVEDVYFLASQARIRFSIPEHGRLLLHGLPVEPPDPFDTVICVDFVGQPQGVKGKHHLWDKVIFANRGANA